MSIQYNDLNFENDYDSSLLLCCVENIINFLNTLPIIENINKLEFYQNNNFQYCIVVLINTICCFLSLSISNDSNRLNLVKSFSLLKRISLFYQGINYLQ